MWIGIKNVLKKIAPLIGLSGPEATAAPVEDTTQALRSARLQAHMRALQLKSVLDNLGVSLLSTMGVAALAAWALWAYMPHTASLVWLGLVVVAVAIRLLHRRYLQKELVEDGRWLAEQMNWLRFGCVVNGFLWGALSIWFFPQNEPVAQSLLIFIITGVSAAAIAVLAADQLCAMAVVLPAAVPLSIRFMLQPDDVGRAMGIISL